jgi:hypothetical protein
MQIMIGVLYSFIILGLGLNQLLNKAPEVTLEIAEPNTELLSEAEKSTEAVNPFDSDEDAEMVHGGGHLPQL